MLHSTPEQTPGATSTAPAGAPTSDPGTTAAGGPDQPTLHEFFTRLVGNPESRSAFEADPRASLDGAGLGDMTATDVLQGASLVLDYAPVEVVQEYGRSLQSSVEMFAASTQHAAINQLHPAQEHELQEATEPSMLNNSSSNGNADYSSEGDTDAQMEQSQHQGNEVNINHEHETSVEHTDSHNVVSVHDIASDNTLGVVGNSVGVVGNAIGGEGNTVGDAVGNTVETASKTVDNTVDTGTDLASGAPAAVENVAGNVTSDLSAGELPVDDVAGRAAETATSTVGGVAGDLPVAGGVAETATSTVSGVTGDLPVAGGVTEGLGGPQPLDASSAPMDGVSGIAGGAVEQVQGIAGGATSDLPLDAL